PGRAGLDPGVALVRRLAGVLPADVRVRSAAPAPPAFDARFAAVARRYVYRLSDCPAGVDPLRRHDVVWHPRPLDVAAAQRACDALLGLHDFAAFCRRREGASTVRTLRRAEWDRTGDLVEVTVEADAFCHNMVRALTGALVAVADGRRPPTWPGEVLAGCRRDPGINVAPARGLTLEAVLYPRPEELAARAQAARARRDAPRRPDPLAGQVRGLPDTQDRRR
ncbi:MAG: tRNA pseudouridine(38-40) synthase TruA, partial [Actinomycetota bacterium]|nr:tRNA pseudouridine(38-40) synthase TruA [Actinomycetota bacterium]